LLNSAIWETDNLLSNLATSERTENPRVGGSIPPLGTSGWSPSADIAYLSHLGIKGPLRTCLMASCTPGSIWLLNIQSDRNISVKKQEVPLKLRSVHLPLTKGGHRVSN